MPFSHLRMRFATAPFSLLLSHRFANKQRALADLADVQLLLCSDDGHVRHRVLLSPAVLAAVVHCVLYGLHSIVGYVPDKARCQFLLIS